MGKFDITLTVETTKLAHEILHILNGHSFKDIAKALELTQLHIINQEIQWYKDRC